jgi:hypothetical protein
MKKSGGTCANANANTNANTNANANANANANVPETALTRQECESYPHHPNPLNPPPPASMDRNNYLPPTPLPFFFLSGFVKEINGNFKRFLQAITNAF